MLQPLYWAACCTSVAMTILVILILPVDCRRVNRGTMLGAVALQQARWSILQLGNWQGELCHIRFAGAY